ncbi:Ig-like domain-containing protein [Pseudomonas alvandae]|uniref:Ig-like domain-containing protein n=1 Tax=Pseudomonas TaxID=286 RepID=UPI00389AA15F
MTWSTSLGSLSAASSTTNASGQATVTLKGTVAGSATVTASAVAGSATAAVTLTPNSATADVTSLVATPTSIVANGTTTSTLVATVKDANGNTLGAGVAVTWSTSLGSLSAASSTTNASGQATVTLKGTVAGSATVTASAVAGSATATVTLTPDSATAAVTALVATPTSVVANGSSTSTLVATVKDANGNTLGAGINVTWTTTGGTLSAASSVTNSSGQATIVLRSSTAAVGVTVKAAAVAGFANAGVTFTADLSTVRVVDVEATPTSIVANGSDVSTLVATVLDANNNSVGAGVAVSWTTSLGTLSATSTTTNASGKVTVTLSGSVAGSATVRASAVAGSATAAVTLQSAAPVISSFSEQGRSTQAGSSTFSASRLHLDREIAYYEENNFSWSATGATRYEVVDPWDNVVYSGSGTSFSLSNKVIPGQFGSDLYLKTNDGDVRSYTLKAFNGDAMSTRALPLTIKWYSCGGGCSGT